MSELSMNESGLESLIALLRNESFNIIGPILLDGVIHYDEIFSAKDIPAGVRDFQEPGKYSISKTGQNRLFGFNNGPDSLKKYFYPSGKVLFTSQKNPDGSIVFTDEKPDNTKYAFIGVRACELKALEIHDRVFKDNQYPDEHYSAVRKNSLIITVNCTVSADTCFCSSMNTGPETKDGFDISLTEIEKDGEFQLIAKSGSAAGIKLLEKLGLAPASDIQKKSAAEQIQAAAASQSRKVDFSSSRDILRTEFSSDTWDKISESCLHCTNCTMVCPTCFCFNIEDATDLSGNEAVRTRNWDSCFRQNFSGIHGGVIRSSGKSRYRQWLSHKFTNWFDQFGSAGCTGCGRCISWCPAGIDITASAGIFLNKGAAK